MAKTKLPQETIIRRLKCQRWGVCDAGSADICDVDIKTVHQLESYVKEAVADCDSCDSDMEKL